MFGHRYFGARYFAPRYFGDGGTPVASTGDTEEVLRRILEFRVQVQQVGRNR